MNFSRTQLSKVVQLGGFLMPGEFANPLFDKMDNSLFKAALEVLGILNKIEKGKSIPITLLDVWFINDRYVVDSIDVKGLDSHW